ncbi:MAG: hypothetical protein ACD_23C00530G0001 [uncultured bacterium]|nr:MAG: hypothetical protein ACD_23C00530G0001 [uncultured bacterium]
MTLPIRARVEAAPNFISNLKIAHQFFLEQDADSAPERYRKLKVELREMVTVLSWSPASGHPARFFTARSAQARLRTQTVQQLAAQAGLPNLREYIVNRHIVLYAHSETEVVLLALKHQRQLTYLAES